MSTLEWSSVTLWQVFASIVLAVAAVRYRPTWKILRHAVTLIHEMGHATIGVIFGAGLHGIKLNSDSSGTTTTSHAVSGGFPGARMFTSLAGYPASGLFGGAAVMAALYGYGRYGWIALLVMGLITLAFSRSLFTVLSAFTFSAIAASFVFLISDSWVTISVLAFVGGLLIVGGLEDLRQLKSIVRHPGKDGEQSDAESLRILTGIPAIVWVYVMLLIFVASASGAAYAINLVAGKLS